MLLALCSSDALTCAKRFLEPRCSSARSQLNCNPIPGSPHKPPANLALESTAHLHTHASLQIYVALPEGQVLTYDFGPVGGRDTTLRSGRCAGRRDAQPCILDLLPGCEAWICAAGGVCRHMIGSMRQGGRDSRKDTQPLALGQPLTALPARLPACYLPLPSAMPVMLHHYHRHSRAA